ncbi:hypothetical protein ACFXGT_02140 [Streptomyces sp. NPDC059352]|uniref:HAAS signaling domain-containing protein n=1 Tax=Streptomyces sp. NPDC059352 TaxID=3346810 RepID=UPI00368CD62E
MTSTRDQLIDEYLRRFDNASVFLPADRRVELRQEIVEHIEAGLEEADTRHAEVVRTVLERLGPPADIVAAEVSGPRSTGSTPVLNPIAPHAAQKCEADGQEQLRQDGAAGPHVSSSPSRRRTMFLIGAGTTVLAIGALTVGVNTSGGDPVRPPVHETPISTYTEDEGPSSTPPSEEPTTANDGSTTPPSEPSYESTASPS